MQEATRQADGPKPLGWLLNLREVLSKDHYTCRVSVIDTAANYECSLTKLCVGPYVGSLGTKGRLSGREAGMDLEAPGRRWTQRRASLSSGSRNGTSRSVTAQILAK